jgi:PAS domain S-box-containing protein
MAAQPSDHVDRERRRRGDRGPFKFGLYHYLLKPDGFDELVRVTGATIESKRREDFRELTGTLFDSMPDGIHCVNAAGNIIAINTAARKLYGYSATRIVGRTNEVLLPAAMRDEMRRLRERAFGGEIVPRFPTYQVRSDGAEIAVAMTIFPMRDADGAVANIARFATPIAPAIPEVNAPVPYSGRH